MEHFFNLPVTHDEEELLLPGRLVTFGYTFRLYIMLENEEVIFERDEEMKYNVLNIGDENVTVDRELLMAVLSTLEELSEKTTYILSYPIN
ncbi:MAG TPA: hypothetical protein VL098_04925 [Flavipsychrobacter sp.]|nr:hypothetical protein [Flavipsychrobacter sp.]